MHTSEKNGILVRRTGRCAYESDARPKGLRYIARHHKHSRAGYIYQFCESKTFTKATGVSRNYYT